MPKQKAWTFLSSPRPSPAAPIRCTLQILALVKRYYVRELEESGSTDQLDRQLTVKRC